MRNDNTMDLYTATMIAEGDYDAAGIDPYNDDVEGLTIDAFQKLIDTGVVWSLQGSFGRAAEHLIKEGYCRV